MDKALKIYQLWLKIPTTEVWNNRIFDATLQQIDFAYKNKLISRDDTNMLLHELLGIIDDSREMARNGTKGGNGTFSLYMSDMLIGNKTILISGEKNYLTFMVTNFFTFITTRDNCFGEMTEHWLHGLIEKSTLISHSNQTVRNIIFKELESTVSAFLKD